MGTQQKKAVTVLINKNSRCVIIAGGVIDNAEIVKSRIKDGDFVVYCDSALRYKNALGAAPQLIVGDFDSFDRKNVNDSCEIITLKPEKDETDSFHAVKTVLERGFRDILILGGTGGRFDHTMANVSALCYIDKHGARGEMADSSGRYFILSDGSFEIKKGECRYFGIIPLDTPIEDLSITGAKYPLSHAKVDFDYLYTTSNEVSSDKCVITLKNARALIFLADR